MLLHLVILSSYMQGRTGKSNCVWKMSQTGPFYDSTSPKCTKNCLNRPSRDRKRGGPCGNLHNELMASPPLYTMVPVCERPVSVKNLVSEGHPVRIAKDLNERQGLDSLPSSKKFAIMKKIKSALKTKIT